MNEPPYFDFGLPRPDLRPVTVRITRPMMLRRIGEAQPRHAEAGEVLTISRYDLAPLTERHEYELAEKISQG